MHDGAWRVKTVDALAELLVWFAQREVKRIQNTPAANDPAAAEVGDTTARLPAPASPGETSTNPEDHGVQCSLTRCG